nr:mucin-7-like [Aegilops tauschii subsp. strangulata]
MPYKRPSSTSLEPPKTLRSKPTTAHAIAIRISPPPPRFAATFAAGFGRPGTTEASAPSITARRRSCRAPGAPPSSSHSPPSSSTITETTLDLATLRRISPTPPPPPRTTGAAAPSTLEPPSSVAVVATL